MAGSIITTTAVLRAMAVTRAAREPTTEVRQAGKPGTAPPLPKLVSLAADLAQQGPPIDYAKIAQVRQAIATGRQVIDLEATAAAIIDFDRADRASS
jgi:negative regulator of flagellin synthesis FlgM